MLPASRKSTPWRTHSYMMPEREHAAFDRRADAAGAANAVDRPQVMLVARLGQAAAVEIDAQAGAEQGLLDVVGGQGVAGEEHVDVAHADQLLAGTRRCRCGRWPARRPAASCRPAARCSASSRAISRMASPLGFSVETALSMKSKVCGAARPLFGKDPHARVADDDRVAPPALVHRQAAGRRRRPRRPRCRSPSPDPRPATHWPARRTSVRWLVVL